MSKSATTYRAPVDWDRGGLPPWTYHGEELTELEKDVLFRRHWQLVCHVSDVAEPGDWVAFDMAFYPDSTLFYQECPIGARRTVQRGATYRYREESRELRLSRYLSGRIDRVTGREDTQLIEWTWEAMQSSAFDGIFLSDREYLVRSYHDTLRATVPVMTLEHAPAGGTLSDTNARMSRSLGQAPETAPAAAQSQ